ncbi:MAG: ParB N-terminal domain-containing protein [Eubacteriales bacterium]|nr:ParB N-terminal domain-containing protein [Eubacteriales bacterium]
MKQTKKYFYVNINDIKPYENNPRYNEQAVEAVKESIKQCTYIAPIVIDEDNIILAGHTRHKALETEELGIIEDGQGNTAM